MIIDVSDQTNTLTEKQKNLIKDIIAFAMEEEQLRNNTEVSITIVSNKEIEKLNKAYRGIDAPTDVLSFEMDEPITNTSETDTQMVTSLGDIIISIEKVNEQSKEYHHSFERELAFLTVHGFLHLLGYTHDKEDEEKIMFDKQERILEAFELER